MTGTSKYDETDLESLFSCSQHFNKSGLNVAFGSTLASLLRGVPLPGSLRHVKSINVEKIDMAHVVNLDLFAFHEPRSDFNGV